MRRQALTQFIVASVVLMIASTSVEYQASDTLQVGLWGRMSMTTMGLWALILIVTWRGLPWHHHKRLGPANTVTMVRATGTALLAGLVPIADQLITLQMTHWLWIATLFAVALLVLDGVDGYLARMTGFASTFGARFDMEVDALLALVLSVLLWQSGEVGIWILGLGIMRYLFVLAGFRFRALQAPLYPSLRRKAICVLQLATLCAILSPLIEPPWSDMLGWIALSCLAASFIRDGLWLHRPQSR